MTDEDKVVSRRVLNRALFNLGHTSQMPAAAAELRLALIKALRPIVGGSDGLWAALYVLQEADGAAAEITTRDAVRFYYRSKSQGSRVTLRAAAAKFKLSYEAVRKCKQRYDADGGWGSAKHAHT